ncbi:MAG: glycosyltransferase family 39 protein [Anaerolineales bacterium]|nr:glycosyltransferase family 39 protein [Anaerolineales bacterium]
MWNTGGKRPFFGLTRWFWLGNLLLWLLLGWAQTEVVVIEVVQDGSRCRALLPEGRSSEITCYGVANGSVGIYQPAQPRWAQVAARLPWDWVWEQQAALQLPAWQQTPDGLKVTVPQWGLARRQTTLVEGADRVTVRLRRLDGEVGVVLLGENGRFGYTFIVSSDNRRGVWWQWQDGRPTVPLEGVPFQKPVVAQLQTLTRKVIGTTWGIWLLLPLAALLRRLVSQIEQVRRQTTDQRPPFVVRRPLSIVPFPLKMVPLIWLAFALALLIASRVLERVPHVQDSVTYLFQAQTLARGSLTAPAPPLPDFFTQEFLLVRQGKWFGKYPPGFPLLLAVGVRLGVPWVVNPLLAVLSLSLLFQLGRRLYGREVGVITAVLALASPFFVIMTGTYMAHVAELFWVLLFMVAWLAGQKRRLGLARRVAFWSLAGVALGMALLTRQFAAMAVGVPFALLTLLQNILRKGAKTQRPKAFFCAFAPLRELQVGQLAVVGLLTGVAVGLLLGYQWRVTGNPWLDPRLLFWPYDRVGFGEGVGESSNVILFDNRGAVLALTWVMDPTQPPRGHTLARGLYNVKQNWLALAAMFLVVPGGLALVWLGVLGRRPVWGTWVLGGTAVSGITAYIFYWHPGIMYGPRYFYAILPALLLLAGQGLKTAVGQRQVVALLLGLLLLAGIVKAPQWAAAYRDFNFVDGDLLAQVQETIQTPALVFVGSKTGDWWDYGAFFSANTPWLDGPIVFARDQGEAANRRLLAAFPNRVAYVWRDGVLVKLGE